jgi:coatomer subunit beta'
MNIATNPKDTNTFAAACVDRTVKVRSTSNPTPNFSFGAHEKGGVNFVEHYHGNDISSMITTGDDRTTKTWDYLSKSCIQTLEGHTSNVSFAVYHPRYRSLSPVSRTGQSRSAMRIRTAERIQSTTCSCVALRTKWATGFDGGVVLLKLGRDEPSY